MTDIFDVFKYVFENANSEKTGDDLLITNNRLIFKNIEITLNKEAKYYCDIIKIKYFTKNGKSTSKYYHALPTKIKNLVKNAYLALHDL